MTPNQQQLDIGTEWDTTDNNIVISSVAGSGKTTTLLYILEKCDARTLFIAFNRSIKEEIEVKLIKRGLNQGKAMTMHSIGLMAVKNYRPIFIKNNKNWDLIKKLKDNNKRLLKSSNYEDINKLLFQLTEMNDVSRMYMTDDLEELSLHFATMGKIFTESKSLETLWKEMIELRNESYEQKKIDIDFLDMLYIPIYKNLEIPIYPSYLMIDEAQDLSLLQHKIFDKLLSQGTIKKWIAVGDRRQSIYGFAGSSSESFDLFLQKPNTVEMNLSLCYRCPELVVQYANRVYDIMTPAKDYAGIVAEIHSINSIKDNSLIICRNTAPLLNCYFDLAAQNRKVHFLGNEIINSLISFLNGYKDKTLSYAKKEMEYKIEELYQGNYEKNKWVIFKLEENVTMVDILTEKLNLASYEKIDSIIEKLKEIFVGNKEGITLATIHKSKGLESDVVYILNERLIPSKFAKSEVQLEQEQNLKYIARSRAKEELYFLNIEENE